MTLYWHVDLEATMGDESILNTYRYSHKKYNSQQAEEIAAQDFACDLEIQGYHTFSIEVKRVYIVSSKKEQSSSVLLFP